MKESHINIGTKIDLADLLTSRLLIQANSGGGKSAIARVIMEKVYGKIPFIVLDFDGEYYTLKEKFGDVLVIGGQYADVPISLKSAKLLPREIIGNGLSVVIDLSDLKTDERILYSKYFLESLMDLPKQYWLSYLVFIEEAHKLCGQQDKYPSGPAVKDLMSRGRKMGYCGVLLTQRISKLHKDAAAECNNKFIGRTFLDLDMNRAGDELAFTNKNDKFLLRDLKPGHFYAFGTSIDPHHVHEVTIEMPQTKMPKAGISLEIKPQKPTDKLKATLAKLNDLPQEAEKEMKNIRDLQGEVSRLKSELSKATKTPVGLHSTKDSNQNAELKEKLRLAEQHVKQYQGENRDLKKAINIYEERHTNLANQIAKIAERMTDSHGVKVGGIIPLNTDIIPKNHTSIPKIDMNIPQKPKIISPGNGSLGKCSLAILRFLAQFSDRSFTKPQIGVAIGYSPTSSSFQNSLSELNTMGLTSREAGRIQINQVPNLTEFTGEFQPQEYSAHTFKEKLEKCARETYEVLLADPEGEYTKEQLAEKTESNYSPTSSSYQNSLSKLNTLELIRRNGGRIKLNPELLELV
jgi:hypothetical protein